MNTITCNGVACNAPTLAAIFALAITFTLTACSTDGGGGNLSSSSNGSNGGYTGSYGSLKDDRDDKTYKTVVIGTQTWMAENLNYNASDSRCYGENGRVYDNGYWSANENVYITLTDEEVQNNCITYGRLYNWATAKSACPSGWHLPSNAEWTTLEDYVGNNAGIKLKAVSNWDVDGCCGKGTDDYGFRALPGGLGGFHPAISYNELEYFYFEGIGNWAGWWSASGFDRYSGYFWVVHYNTENLGYLPNGGYEGWFSVRCVKD
jgi:uncharacterized protein (TIGR02145 family)